MRLTWRLGRWGATGMWVVSLGCSSEADPAAGTPGPEHGIVEVDPNSVPLGEQQGGSGGSGSVSAGNGAVGSGARAGAAGGSSGGAGPTAGGSPAFGTPCESASDCPRAARCNSDTIDYIAHKQCTTTCDASAQCKVADPDAICIGANICVHTCETNADCPLKTLCNAAGWCERTGPGSGVPYCSGFATPCGLLSELDCTGTLGCRDDSRCDGLATSCYSLFDSYSCGSQDGCYWSTSSKGCSGVARSCSGIVSEFACNSQDGCSYTPRCTGTARACEEQPVPLCETQPGCSTRID